MEDYRVEISDSSVKVYLEGREVACLNDFTVLGEPKYIRLAALSWGESKGYRMVDGLWSYFSGDPLIHYPDKLLNSNLYFDIHKYDDRLVHISDDGKVHVKRVSIDLPNRMEDDFCIYEDGHITFKGSYNHPARKKALELWMGRNVDKFGSRAFRYYWEHYSSWTVDGVFIKCDGECVAHICESGLIVLEPGYEVPEPVLKKAITDDLYRSGIQIHSDGVFFNRDICLVVHWNDMPELVHKNSELFNICYKNGYTYFYGGGVLNIYADGSKRAGHGEFNIVRNGVFRFDRSKFDLRYREAIRAGIIYWASKMGEDLEVSLLPVVQAYRDYFREMPEDNGTYRMLDGCWLEADDWRIFDSADGVEIYFEGDKVCIIDEEVLFTEFVAEVPSDVMKRAILRRLESLDIYRETDGGFRRGGELLRDLPLLVRGYEGLFGLRQIGEYLLIRTGVGYAVRSVLGNELLFEVTSEVYTSPVRSNGFGYFEACASALASILRDSGYDPFDNESLRGHDHIPLIKLYLEQFCSHRYSVKFFESAESYSKSSQLLDRSESEDIAFLEYLVSIIDRVEEIPFIRRDFLLCRAEYLKDLLGEGYQEAIELVIKKLSNRSVGSCDYINRVNENTINPVLFSFDSKGNWSKRNLSESAIFSMKSEMPIFTESFKTTDEIAISIPNNGIVNHEKNRVKDRVIFGSYRVVGRKLTRVVKGAILGSLRSHGAGNDALVIFDTFLDTKFGSAMISALIGILLEYFGPKLPIGSKQEILQKLSEEMQIEGGSIGLDAISDEMIRLLTPALEGMSESSSGRFRIGSFLEDSIESEEGHIGSEVVRGADS